MIYYKLQIQILQRYTLFIKKIIDIVRTAKIQELWLKYKVMNEKCIRNVWPTDIETKKRKMRDNTIYLKTEIELCSRFMEDT